MLGVSTPWIAMGCATQALSQSVCQTLSGSFLGLRLCPPAPACLLNPKFSFQPSCAHYNSIFICQHSSLNDYRDVFRSQGGPATAVSLRSPCSRGLRPAQIVLAPLAGAPRCARHNHPPHSSPRSSLRSSHTQSVLAPLTGAPRFARHNCPYCSSLRSSHDCLLTPLNIVTEV